MTWYFVDMADMARCCVTWPSLMWYGMMWCHGTYTVWYGLISCWCDARWHDVICCYEVWHGVIWLSMRQRERERELEVTKITEYTNFTNTKNINIITHMRRVSTALEPAGLAGRSIRGRTGTLQTCRWRRSPETWVLGLGSWFKALTRRFFKALVYCSDFLV